MSAIDNSAVIAKSEEIAALPETNFLNIRFIGSKSGNAMMYVDHSTDMFAAIGVTALPVHRHEDGSMQNATRLYQMGERLWFVQFDNEDAMNRYEELMRADKNGAVKEFGPFRQLWPPVE